MDREAQEGTQGRAKRCKVAEDSVVVKKSRPEKAGNRLEEKTGMIPTNREAGAGQKQHRNAKGGSLFNGLWKLTVL